MGGLGCEDDTCTQYQLAPLTLPLRTASLHLDRLPLLLDALDHLLCRGVGVLLDLGCDLAHVLLQITLRIQAPLQRLRLPALPTSTPSLSDTPFTPGLAATVTQAGVNRQLRRGVHTAAAAWPPRTPSAPLSSRTWPWSHACTPPHAICRPDISITHAEITTQAHCTRHTHHGYYKSQKTCVLYAELTVQTHCQLQTPQGWTEWTQLWCCGVCWYARRPPPAVRIAGENLPRCVEQTHTHAPSTPAVYP
jgi:hypothetical protein